ncbi:hypothetical protein VTL71DRAFT_8946 [Oculimacula yallundae]|uniref:Uncharacterized protein n=1 Tax=Oculimacula yallundae TaxID=86028 RepID=A0ABR4BTD4_9HELO
MPEYNLEQNAIEHASTSKFWLFAVSIIAFWIFTAVTPPQPPFVPITTSQVPFNFTTRIQPFITNPLRRRALVVVYIGILCLQLLEGRWVLKTTFRFAGVFFEAFPTYEESSIWAYMMYLNSSAIVCCFVIIVALFGAVVVVTQVLAILELTIGTPQDVVQAGEKGSLCIGSEKMEIEIKMGEGSN